MKKHLIILSSYLFLTIVISLIFLQAFNQHYGKELSFIFLFLLWIVGLLMTIILFIAHFRLLGNKSKTEKAHSSNPQDTSSHHTQTQYQEQINKDEVLNELIRTASTKTSIVEFSEELLKKMAKEFSIVQGVFYVFNKKEKNYKVISSYAFMSEEKPEAFFAGDGLNGQAVLDKKIKIIEHIPEDYRIVLSGLGESKPTKLYLIPLIDVNKTLGLVEISTFKTLSESRLKILEQLIPEAGKLLNKYL
jgi:GAF domain